MKFWSSFIFHLALLFVSSLTMKETEEGEAYSSSVGARKQLTEVSLRSWGEKPAKRPLLPPSSKSPSKKLELSSLRIDPADINEKAAHPFKGLGQHESGEVSPVGLGKISGGKEENVSRRFLNSIYRQIQDNLVYPSEVVAAKKEGQVTVEFLVDEKGQLVEIERIEAGDRILKVLALKSLRQALKNPLALSPSGQKGPMKIKSVFRFFISSRYHGSNLIEEKNLDRLFYFYKTATDSRVFASIDQGGSGGRSIRRPDDPRAGVRTTYDVFDNGLLQLQSSSASRNHRDQGTGSVGFGIDYVKLIQWFVTPSTKNTALEKYKDDPDF